MTNNLPISALPQHYFHKVIESYDSVDKIQHTITSVLQEIDDNFSRCHKLSLEFYQEISRHHELQLQVNESLSKWSGLFRAVKPDYSASVSNKENRKNGNKNKRVSFSEELKEGASTPSTSRHSGKIPTPRNISVLSPTRFCTMEDETFQMQSDDYEEDIRKISENYEKVYTPKNKSGYEDVTPVSSTPTIPSSSREKLEFPHSDVDSHSWIEEKLYVESGTCINTEEEDMSEDPEISQSKHKNTKSPPSRLRRSLDLNIFPKVFQSTPGSNQVTEIYHQIQEKSVTINDILSSHPEYDRSCVEIILDLLLRKGFIRSGNDMWFI